MNFWPLLTIGILGAIYLVGFIALIYCAKRAPEGYEDVDGFRLGAKPGPPLVLSGREHRDADGTLGGVGHAV